MRPLVLLVALSLYAAPAAAEITLSAPASVPAGAPYPVTWSGDGNPRDFITLVPVGTAEGKYEAYTYANQPTVELLAPDDPGDYELRYLDNASPYATRARLAVTVTPVTATLTVAPTAEGGSQISVAWTGPDNARDFITIVPADTPERTYNHYVYTSKGSPVTLRAPDAPGDYEIRYLTAQKYYTLASAPVRVGGAEATLSGPSRVDAGQTFNVQWTGPDNDLDWIGLFPAGAENNAYAMYRYTKAGNPAELRAPDNPGSYEARYLTAQNTVLGTLAVEVGAVSASVSAPAEVVGGAWFEFSWTGPDNPGDYIGMVAAGAGDRARHAVYAYTKKGNPGSMSAPLEPGDYELRYETGQSGSVLASTPIRVTPPTTAPGTVVVAFAQSAGLSANDGVEIILDASGSMLKKQEGKRRIDIAKDVLLNLAGADIPAGTPFALRVFGHKEKDSCRTDLEIALAPLDVARDRANIQPIEAMNLTKTHIAASLDLAAIRPRWSRRSAPRV